MLLSWLPPREAPPLQQGQQGSELAGNGARKLVSYPDVKVGDEQLQETNAVSPLLLFWQHPRTKTLNLMVRKYSAKGARDRGHC